MTTATPQTQQQLVKKKSTSPKAPAGKAGRRTKYTPETVRRIVEAVRLGATYELAMAYAGIGHTQFHVWMNTKPEFAEAVKNAEGAAAVGWLAKIEQAAAEGNWQAAAWKLERRYPQLYGRTVQQQVQSGNVTHKIEIVYVNDWRAVKYGTEETVVESAAIPSPSQNLPD